MDITDTIKENRKNKISSFTQLGIIYVGLILLFIFLVVISNILDIPIEHFTADPAATYQAHPLTGFLSNIGALFWCVACVACFFAFAVLKKTVHKRRSNFLLASGVVSLILLFDDMFMFHEAIFPWYFHIPQKAVYAGYLLIMLAYFFYFQKQIFKSEYLLLVTSVFFLALSVIGDFILPQDGLAYLVEDGLKVFGIAAWFLYFWRLSFKHVSREISST